MKRTLSIAVLVLLLFSNGFSRQSEADNYAETITIDDLNDYLSILSSDAFEGRETGERGQKLAAAFISYHFKQWGLEAPVNLGTGGSYYQPLNLYSSIPGETYLKIKEDRFLNFEDVVYYGNSNTGKEMDIEVVFVGKGDEESFGNVDVEGKAALVIVDDVRAWRKPAELAQQNGALMIFAVNTSSDEEFNGLASQLEHFLAGGSLSLEKPKAGSDAGGIFFISPGVANELTGHTLEKLKETMKEAGGGDFKSMKKVKSKKIKYRIEQKVKVVETENVLGYIEGTDKKDELVVLTAHYDHVGIDGDEVYNGADDDGSGTSAVMEIAQAFIKAKNDGKGPRRSMLFLLVTGEEKGLLGSEYYADNPVFPLEKTIVDLNIDMIGRVDPEHKDNPNYVYLVGSDRLSTELHEISENVNSTYTKLELDYTFNDEDHPDRIYYRSDHWNFAKNNVPIIFYFNGVHEDYHQPTDTIEKINFELLKERTKLVFYTAWELANRDNRPVVDKIDDGAGEN